MSILLNVCSLHMIDDESVTVQGYLQEAGREAGFCHMVAGVFNMVFGDLEVWLRHSNIGMTVCFLGSSRNCIEFHLALLMKLPAGTKCTFLFKFVQTDEVVESQIPTTAIVLPTYHSMHGTNSPEPQSSA
jgi:hypothetical protein